MKPCLSEATTMAASFAEDVTAYADAGCPAMEVWLTKLETHLQQHTPAETQRIVAERGLTLAVAAYQGGILLSQGAQRRTHLDHFQKRLSICQEFDIRTMVVVGDFIDPVSPSDVERAQASLQQAAELAGSFHVRLALEFQGKATWCASLDTALAMVRGCEQKNLGINFDVFHYYTGPSKAEDLNLLSSDNLFHVQLSDVAGVPRELAGDTDRILPGDGDFQIKPIIEHFRGMGYDGWISVELMNPELWKMKPSAVAEAAMGCLRRWME